VERLVVAVARAVSSADVSAYLVMFVAGRGLKRRDQMVE
jgi:hypothetical protein